MERENQSMKWRNTATPGCTARNPIDINSGLHRLPWGHVGTGSLAEEMEPLALSHFSRSKGVWMFRGVGRELAMANAPAGLSPDVMKKMKVSRE